MNVAEILSEMYVDLDYESIPAPAVTERLKAYVQRAYVQILREPDLHHLRDTLQPLTFSSVTGQAIYGLPSSIARPIALTDRTNNRLLTPMTLFDLRLNDPGLTSNGTPWAWVPLGYGATQFAPASKGIWVASANAGDLTQLAQIHGIRANGLPTGDLVATLNGTTRVQIPAGAGPITDIVDLQHVSLSAPALGVVSFFDAATAGNVVAQIGVGQITPRYVRLLLYPTPSAAILYYVDGQLQIPKLDDEQDVPLLPESFHNLLVTGGLIHEYKRKDDSARIANLLPEMQRGLDRLKHEVSATATDIPVKGQRQTRRFSRFGSWTPADW